MNNNKHRYRNKQQIKHINTQINKQEHYTDIWINKQTYKQASYYAKQKTYKHTNKQTRTTYRYMNKQTNLQTSFVLTYKYINKQTSTTTKHMKYTNIIIPGVVVSWVLISADAKVGFEIFLIRGLPLFFLLLNRLLGNTQNKGMH